MANSKWSFTTGKQITFGADDPEIARTCLQMLFFATALPLICTLLILGVQEKCRIKSFCDGTTPQSFSLFHSEIQSLNKPRSKVGTEIYKFT
jgi:hypothetical protein